MIMEMKDTRWKRGKMVEGEANHCTNSQDYRGETKIEPNRRIIKSEWEA